MMNVLAPLFWGFCEAVFFFIVPDVWLTGVVLFSRDLRSAFRAMAWALLGALLGGIFLYSLGRYGNYEQLVLWLDKVPGISATMIEGVHVRLQEQGLGAIFLGVLKGEPYKIYALHWGGLSGGVSSFLAFSVLARAGRFSLSILLTRVIDLFASGRIPQWDEKRKAVLAIFWLAFYIFYFGHFGF